jgi:nucleotidyltransferase substrate binding protein (TIGR01987 family)
MNRLDSQLADLRNILKKWEQALNAPDDKAGLRRDSSILRFELAFEVCWKCLQTVSRDQGFESRGPRQSIENAFRLGLIDDETVWYEILKSRNLAIHVYREEWAEELYSKLNTFYSAFDKLAQRVESL